MVLRHSGLKPIGQRHEQRRVDAKLLKRVTVGERVDALRQVGLGLFSTGEVAAHEKHLDNLSTVDLHYAEMIVHLMDDAVQSQASSGKWPGPHTHARR
jgi:hypothetical protein